MYTSSGSASSTSTATSFNATSNGSGGSSGNANTRPGAPSTADRTSDSNSTSQGLQTSLRKISSLAEFKLEIDKCRGDSHVLVVDFSAGWCPPSKEFSPRFEQMAAQNPSAVFVVVDVDEASDVSQFAGVTAMPTVKFYVDGRVVETVVGLDEAKVRKRLKDFMRLQRGISERKQAEQDAAHPPTAQFNDGPGSSGGALPPPPQPNVKHNVVHKAKPRKVDDDEEAGPSPADLAAALEEACAELGYTLDQIEEILTSGNYPDELLELMMQKTGCKEKSDLVDHLKPQRAPLLQKVRDNGHLITYAGLRSHELCQFCSSAVLC